jgi:hypothetical protein
VVFLRNGQHVKVTLTRAPGFKIGGVQSSPAVLGAKDVEEVRPRILVRAQIKDACPCVHVHNCLALSFQDLPFLPSPLPAPITLVCQTGGAVGGGGGLSGKGRSGEPMSPRPSAYANTRQ